MTTIFDEETEQASDERFERETAGVGQPLETPEGEVIAPPAPEPEVPLETLITPQLCGLIMSIPGLIRAKQTGHEWWKLDNEEKQLLGEAWQPFAVWAVRKYLGETVGMFTAAAVATVLVYSPRQIREMQERPSKRGPGAPPKSPPSQPPDRQDSPVEYQPSSVNEDVGSPANSGGWHVNFQE